MKLNPTKKQQNSALHKIPRWCIDHSYSVIAFYVAVIALSIIVVTQILPRRFAPYVQSPMIGIVTMMPGLSAQDMELYASKPIEEQMASVKGTRFIRSTSQDGISIVTLEFPYGTDMQKALVDVQTLINVTQSFLPGTNANLKPSFVVPIDALNLPILSLSLTGDPAQGWTPIKVREFADNTMINRLKTVHNVYAVVPFGGFRKQLQVIANRGKLASYGLSLLDIKSTIDRYNISQPAGTLTDGAQESTVRLDDRTRSAQEVEKYPIKSVVPSDATTTRAPRVVNIGDVAKVVDSHWERRSAYHYLEHDKGTTGSVTPSIDVSVIQNPGASSAAIIPNVMKVVAQLQQENPGLKVNVAYDNAHFVNILFDNVWHELAIAILLTGIAVLLFLGEWRGTLISMVTLPVSLALAILLMAPLGMSFNSGTLIGLLLSIGRLVDDSIIDIHAVDRHLKMDKSPKEATVDGISEVRVAVLASTLMIVIALAPLLFSGGLTGLMFYELVWPLIFGLLASMLVSFTLTPILCAALLRHQKLRDAERQHRIGKYFYVLLDPIQRWLDKLDSGYGRLIRVALRHRFTVLCGVAGVLIIGFSFYNFLGSEMMPLADTGQASASLEMNPGTSFAGTLTAVDKLEKIILKYPEVEKASIKIGNEGIFERFTPFYTGYEMPRTDGAAIMLTLSDKDQRQRTIWQVIDGIQHEALATIPGIRRLQIKGMGSDVMATSQAPIQYNIYGPDLKVLNRIGQQALVAAKKSPDIFQPATTWSMGVPQYQIKVDPQRAQEAGLTPQSIAMQAYYALHGGLTDTFYRQPNLRQNTIFIRYEQSQRRTPQDLQTLYLTAPDGKQVLLKSVANITLQSSPTAIDHDGLRRTLGITGFYRKGHLPSMDAMMQLASNIYGGNEKVGLKPINFPPGYGMEARGDMTQMMDAFKRMMGGFLLALVLMYLVLVAQFRGFLQPLQMLLSLPLELAGVFVALFLAAQSFSTVSMLGIIVLTGMDITTAVLLIDLIMQYRDRGVPRDKAIAEASPHRLRPILMTSIITMIVMLPVAIAPKTGLDAYQPLATAVVGGLFVGTILSLFVIPVMHSVMDDLMKWINRTFRGRESRWEKPEEE
jgi:HAE1 family hydrophobic/amphiphilic exporter-1